MDRVAQVISPNVKQVHLLMLPIGLGLALGSSITTHWFGDVLITRWAWGAALLAVSAIGSGVAYWVLARFIRPILIHGGATTRYLGSVVTFGSAALYMLVSWETPRPMSWVETAGPQSGQPAAIVNLKAWGVSYPSITLHATENNDPRWVWSALTRLPQVFTLFGGTVHFVVTQDEGGVFDEQRNVRQGGDGVEVRAVIDRNGKPEVVGQLQLNLHARPQDRRWQRFDVSIPAGVDRLLIEALPGPPGSNNWHDRVWMSVVQVETALNEVLLLSDGLSISLLASLVFCVIWKSAKDTTLQRHVWAFIPWRDAMLDCSFLTLVVVVSFLPYVRGLGLYSDDYWFLAQFSNADDQSLLGLVQAIDTPTRPVQALYLAGLYRLFGDQLLFYHVVNSGVFIVSTLLFYLALRELGLARLLTLGISLAYAFLPHFSTDHFWIASFQANLSMMFYFLSLYSDLRALSIQGEGRRQWRLLSIFGMLGSVLFYEVALPLFLFNLLVVWYWASKTHERISTKTPTSKHFPTLVAGNLLALALVVAYKLVVTDRLTMSGSYWSHITRLAAEATKVNLWDYGLGLPLAAGRVLNKYPDFMVVALAAFLALVMFGYLYHSINGPFLRPASCFKVITVGLVVYALGYGVFAVSDQVGFTPTGVDNRIAIAAAVGVAISFVGAIGLASSLVPPRLRRASFCLALTMVCVCGFVITNTIAKFWIAASHAQQQVIAAVRQHFPILPSRSTLILHGVCPYIGPGIVFETYWDVGGMLQMYYRDSTLRGDILNHHLEIKEEGLYTTIYGERQYYPYNDRLMIYHFGNNESYQLTDFASARRYFRAFLADEDLGDGKILFKSDYNSNCPPGGEGLGVKIF